MKIYTRKGDRGRTQLIGGKRVPKWHLRIQAYGAVDELNAFIGYLRALEGTDGFQDFLQLQQEHLFTVGSNLAAAPGAKMPLPQIDESSIDKLEASMDEMEGELPELRNFVLPGGHPANAAAHMCRTICRRAERDVVLLMEEEAVDELIPRYLNRLSDWFFVYGRLISHRSGTPEVLWQSRSENGNG
jgi:cob(I)alamin adenosyltransferase